MQPLSLKQLRLELAIKAKNGMDFILSAGIIWSVIAFIWTLPYTSYDKSVLTFMIGALMLPLAWLLSKVLKTQWKIPDNPLEPLGLWLNFAQLFYFPFLVFVLIKFPDYFVMTYVIITGAHFFPYAWFYDELAFAVAAGLISVGALMLGLILGASQMYVIPLSMSGVLLVLAAILFGSYKRKLASVTAKG